MNKDNLEYYLIRLVTIPLMYLPFKLIHKIGQAIGIIAYYILPKYRKRTLSNLALANDLKLSNKQIKKIAVNTFKNLAINILEYPRLYSKKDLTKIIKCENPEIADQIYNQKKGIIFFCAHQANWEVLFLDGSSRMQGIAIGRPIKNKKLYKWILKIRQKQGGRIISPKNALREGLKTLKKGIFLGILADQGMPNSSYFFPFFGRRAWTTTAPALLSLKTNCPIIVATTKRIKGGYKIHYSDPLWPNQNEPTDKEIKRLMNSSLSLVQESIKQKPEQWLWQHNRWKQQTPKIIYERFRFDCICIILPKEIQNFEKIHPNLFMLKSIYNRAFIFIICPKKYKNYPLIKSDDIIYYKDYKDTLLDDYRFKLIYNFTSYKKIDKHYKKLSAFEVVTIDKLKKLASKKLKFDDLDNLPKVFEAAICRKPLDFFSKS